MGSTLPAYAGNELELYRAWIKDFRSRKIGDVKMQKIRLQLGTYAQRQEGVQMQRIKFPGSTLSSKQLVALADTAEKFASGFIHFTTRADAQLYYLKLEDCPDLMEALGKAGITTREACGNTVRNITACYRSGTDASEAFDAAPYSHALYKFLVRNKYNQVMGRKFKIAFESCAQDHAGMRFHDLGFQAVLRNEGGRERRGFRVYVGGGLGGTPMLGHLYAEFLPVDDMLNLAAAAVRVFDRYGERKNRMAARMKYLIRKIGWDKFRELLDEERKAVKLKVTVEDLLAGELTRGQAPALPKNLPANPGGLESQEDYKLWRRDSIVKHRFPGYAGVHIRLKLGDLPAEPARKVAAIADTFSRGELRISIEQNLYLPWVPEASLPALYKELRGLGLADSGAETMEDTTTCPGADTCRLGITSAKGLGADISGAMSNGLGKYKEMTRGLRVKISGCPNGCAQHGIANIGFQGAALKKDGKTVPAHELFVGGQSAFDDTSFGERMGKFPARNCSAVVEKLVALYSKEKQGDEAFNACMKRLGRERIQAELAPLAEIPSFEDAPDFYKDLGHDNEKFAIRTGIKGECAGAPVQEKAPVMADAKEKLAQAEAFLKHKEYDHAQIQAYETMATAARVPLYASLVDPFTAEQTLWEFENLFVRTGRIDSAWLDLSDRAEAEKNKPAEEAQAKKMIEDAKRFLAVAESLYAEIIQQSAPKNV